MFAKDMPREDCLKVLHFLEQILVEPENFRRQVMVSLARVFGYQISTSWITDSQGNLFSPMTFNVDDRVIRDYIEDRHFENDVLHPRRVGINYVLKKSVLRATDLMSANEFENTKYYSEFFRRFGFYHYLGIYLSDCGRLIGGMALLRSKDEKGFNVGDIRILRSISGPLSRMLAGSLRQAESEHRRRILEDFADRSPDGLVVFDGSLEVRYCNPAAREFCAEVSPGNGPDGPPEEFLKQVLSGCPDWRWGLKKTVLSPELKAFAVQVEIAPDPGNCAGGHLYAARIAPDGSWPGRPGAGRGCPQFRPRLTFREREVLALLARGYSNQEIAGELFISLHTAKKHVQNIFDKMGVKNRTSLCYRLGVAGRNL